MKVVAKKHKLNPVWLADPTNIQLIESNCGLDLELEKLKVGVRTKERGMRHLFGCFARHV
jgi:hypothetical protein